MTGLSREIVLKKAQCKINDACDSGVSIISPDRIIRLMDLNIIE